MRSCPVKTDPDYVEVSRELGAPRAILSYHRNNETMPDLLKAYKLLNIEIPKETIQKKRNEGYRIVKELIESNDKGIKDSDINPFKDILDKYGYDSSITTTKIEGKNYFTDLAGNIISSDMVSRTLEGEKYRTALNKSINVVTDGLSRLFGSNPKNILMDLKSKLGLPDNFLVRLKSILSDIVNGTKNSSLDIPAKAMLINTFRGQKHVSRLISFYKKNPDMVKGLMGSEEYDSLFGNNPNASSFVGEYGAAILIGSVLYDGPDSLSSFQTSDTIRELATRAADSIMDSIDSIGQDDIDNIFENYSNAIKETSTSEEERDRAENFAKSVNTGKDIGDIKNMIARRKRILQMALDIENTRMELEKKGARERSKMSKFSKRLGIILDQAIPLWNSAPEKINYLNAIYDYLNTGLVNDLDKINTQVKNIRGDYSAGNAKIVLSAKRTLDAYKDIMEVIGEELNLIKDGYVEAGINDKMMTELTELVDDLNAKLDSLNLSYSIESNTLLRKFFSPFIPEEGIQLGDTNYTIDDFINVAEKDIGMVDRFLQAVKDSNSPLLRVLNEPVRTATARKYNRTREYAGRIMQLRDKLSKAGYSNDSFMYEMKNGKPTGNFIQKISDQFAKDQKEYIDEHLPKHDEWTYQDAIDAFRRENGNMVNGIYTPNRKYITDAYLALSEPQREYYDKMVSMKQELDKFLPFQARHERRAPQIRKSTVERIFSGGNVFKNIYQAGKEGLVVNQHDNIILERNSIGNKGYKTVPIRNVGLMTDMNDLATDAAGGMIAFADMVMNYDEMNNIVDAMEIMKDYVSNAAIKKTQNGMQVMKTLAGKARTASTIEGEASNLLKRIDDFYSMNIYGEKVADEGTIGKSNVSKRKATNVIIKATVMNTLAFNALAGIANVATGKHNVTLEAVAGEFFNMKDYAFAEKEYWKDLPAMIGDIESSIKKSRVNKISSLFRITQDADDDFRNWDLYKNNKLFRMLNPKYAFAMTNGGEHYIANSMGLAILRATKVYDENGKETNLLAQIDTSGTLAKVKEGTKLPDGSDFTGEDLIKVQGVIRELNERSQGIYNKEDMSAFQSKWMGALAFLYRRYFIPNINRRFGKSNPNLALGTQTEGFYRTLGRVMTNTFWDGQKLGFFYNQYKGTLTPTEKANIKRALYETSYLLAAAIGFSMLSAAGFGDGDDPYWQRMLKYQVRRTRTEVGAFNPFYLPQEIMTLLKSPSATIDYVDKWQGFLRLGRYGHEYQSGPYKGYKVWQRNIIDVAPYYRSFIRNGTPEQTLKFLENN